MTSDLVFKNFCVLSISLIFFELGIPNLVCGCILGKRSLMYHFWVTVTLTSDLVFRIIMSSAYLLTSDLVFKNYCVQSISPIIFDVGIPNLGW